VIVHVRGGGELGDAWHQAGRGLHKETSIHDYVDSIAELIDTGVLASGELVAVGESAGALVAASA
jgi:protease II